MLWREVMDYSQEIGRAVVSKIQEKISMLYKVIVFFIKDKKELLNNYLLVIFVSYP